MNTSNLSHNQERKINSGCRKTLVYSRQRKRMKMESGSSPVEFDLSNIPRRSRRKSKFNGKESLLRTKEILNDVKEVLSRLREDLSTPKEEPSTPKKPLCRPKAALSRPKEAPSGLKEALPRPKEALSTPKKPHFRPKEVLSKPKEASHTPKEALSAPKEVLSRPKGKLDSGVFDIYLKKIWKIFSEDRKKHFAYFDSLWFSLYRIGSSKDKVLTWINKEAIFSKAYVFVPIVCWGHWSLLILCHFGESLQSTTRSPCMLLLDSLEMANSTRLEPEIRRFVLDMYKTGDKPETKHLVYQIPFLVPKVPQQRDGDECGFFSLYFINLFLELAPDNFSTEEYPYFMKKDWFTFEDLDRFSDRLDSLN